MKKYFILMLILLLSHSLSQISVASQSQRPRTLKNRPNKPRIHRVADHNPSATQIREIFEQTDDFDKVAQKIVILQIVDPSKEIIVKSLLKYASKHFVDMQTQYTHAMTSPTQGWKLHVSAKPETMYKIAKVIFPYLAQQKVGWKFTGSTGFFETLNRDDIQKGKFITIYPTSNQQAVDLAQGLNRRLLHYGFTKDDFVQPQYDALVGESGGVSTRYGAYVGNTIFQVDHENNIVDDTPIYDDRHQYKPDFITWNPFGNALTPPYVISHEN